MKNEIRIITSLNHHTTVNDIADYSAAGIDEFYFGFMPREWTKEYGWEICTNRRPYPLIPHITELHHARNLIDAAHRKNRRIYLALNEHLYSERQYRLLIPMLDKLVRHKIDGVLVSDIALILYLKNRGFKIPLHLSVGGGAFNPETVGLFCDLGLTRVVLPRKLHPGEIIRIIDDSPGETVFEVFLMGEWCRYNDAYCFNVHGYRRNELCKLKTTYSCFLDKPPAPGILKEETGYPWCGLCIIPLLKKYLKRIVFKIPLRSGIFSDEFIMKKTIPLIKNNALSTDSFKKLLRCEKKFCAYELNG